MIRLGFPTIARLAAGLGDGTAAAPGDYVTLWDSRVASETTPLPLNVAAV
jgi:hypothetical protein